MFLFINTVPKAEMRVALVSSRQGVLDRQTRKINQDHSEKLLPAIEKIFKDNGSSLSDLRGIGVVRGPGSFTGVRVGVACANALGFALNIPVQGVKARQGRDLIKIVLRKLQQDKFFKPVAPYYQHKKI